MFDWRRTVILLRVFWHRKAYAKLSLQSEIDRSADQPVKLTRPSLAAAIVRIFPSLPFPTLPFLLFLVVFVVPRQVVAAYVQPLKLTPQPHSLPPLCFLLGSRRVCRSYCSSPDSNRPSVLSLYRALLLLPGDHSRCLRQAHLTEQYCCSDDTNTDAIQTGIDAPLEATPGRCAAHQPDRDGASPPAPHVRRCPIGPAPGGDARSSQLREAIKPPSCSRSPRQPPCTPRTPTPTRRLRRAENVGPVPGVRARARARRFLFGGFRLFYLPRRRWPYAAHAHTHAIRSLHYFVISYLSILITWL